MNSKLTSYEEAVKQLKVIEHNQMSRKRYLKTIKNKLVRRGVDSVIQSEKTKINALLSLIAVHKQARRMYGILRDVQKDLGMSSKAYKLVERVLNEKK